MTYEADARPAPPVPATVGAEVSPTGRPRRIRRALSLPLAIVSTVAVTLGIVQPAEAAPQPAKRQPKARSSPSAPAATAVAAVSSAPAEVTVADGDTISSIAERYGLATAEVLALNGLGWSSLIFPGQRLALPGPGHAEPGPAPAPAPEIARHVVAPGDTIAGIAAAHGLGVDDVLSANGLSRQSLIFPGQAIVLPGPQSTDAAAPSPVTAAAVDEVHVVVEGDTLIGIAERHGVAVDDLLELNGMAVTDVLALGREVVVRRPDADLASALAASSVSVPLSDEMRDSARLIVDIGRALGVPDEGIVVALAAAAQESGLRNVRYGDRDSLGLFQQRPSMGWGTQDEVLDPVRATTAFFGGTANPNPGITRGLLDIDGWETMSVTQAAQAVQQSAHPDHYAKWEASARAWLSELG